MEASRNMAVARAGRLLLLGAVVAGLVASAWGILRRGNEVSDLAAVRDSMAAPRQKIVLIGLDGADWQVARPLMERGRLPVLSALVAEGASGELTSIPPMISPALWTTVVTGVSRARHGIRDFVYKEAGAYAQPIVNSSIRRRLALWNILSDLGLSVGVLDWYATWPAEEVNGFVVSDRLRTSGPKTEGVTYPAYESLKDDLSAENPDGFPALERFRRELEPLPEGLAKALREDTYRYRLAKSLYRSHRPEFFAFYFKGIDAVGHFFWKHFQPSVEVYGTLDRDEVALYGSIVPRYYELCDQLLGGFLEVVDRDTVVLIVSDHGFRAFGRPDNLIFDLDRLFSVLGLLEFEDPAKADQRSERKIRMAGTRAYTHEGTMIVSTFGERDRPVYLNLAGRDPEGVIEATSRREARLEIARRLKRLKTDLGSRVFSDVRVNDTEPTESNLQEPDLYVRVNREIAFDNDVVIDGRSYSLTDTFLWEYGNISGTHRENGILIASGPGIEPGVEVRSASLMDIAPTILHLVGAPVPGDFEGRVLRGMLTDPHSRNRLSVRSYEGLVERRYPEVATDRLDEDYRERLRALGYVQ